MRPGASEIDPGLQGTLQTLLTLFTALSPASKLAFVCIYIYLYIVYVVYCVFYVICIPYKLVYGNITLRGRVEGAGGPGAVQCKKEGAKTLTFEKTSYN